jgi:hypothetical protein
MVKRAQRTTTAMKQNSTNVIGEDGSGLRPRRKSDHSQDQSRDQAPLPCGRVRVSNLGRVKWRTTVRRSVAGQRRDHDPGTRRPLKYPSTSSTRRAKRHSTQRTCEVPDNSPPGWPAHPPLHAAAGSPRSAVPQESRRRPGEGRTGAGIGCSTVRGCATSRRLGRPRERPRGPLGQHPRRS